MSAFIKECWRLVGPDARDAKALNLLFHELENLRDRATKFDELGTAYADELQRAQSDVKYRRIQLDRYKERESVHIRPMFSAMMAHLLFPTAPDRESVTSLRRRIDLARDFQVEWANPGGLESNNELEQTRLENGSLKEQIDALKVQVAELEARPVAAEAQLNAAQNGLAGMLAENDKLKKQLAAAEELVRAYKVRLDANFHSRNAASALVNAFREWEAARAKELAHE